MKPWVDRPRPTGIEAFPVGPVGKSTWGGGGGPPQEGAHTVAEKIVDEGFGAQWKQSLNPKLQKSPSKRSPPVPRPPPPPNPEPKPPTSPRL